MQLNSEREVIADLHSKRQGFREDERWYPSKTLLVFELDKRLLKTFKSRSDVI